MESYVKDNSYFDEVNEEYHERELIYVRDALIDNPHNINNTLKEDVDKLHQTLDDFNDAVDVIRDYVEITQKQRRAIEELTDVLYDKDVSIDKDILKEIVFNLYKYNNITKEFKYAINDLKHIHHKINDID